MRAAGPALPGGWTFALAAGDEAAAELIDNLLLFLPLGAALALRGTPRLPTILLGTALSLTVETWQLWIPGRDPSAGDVVVNTISTALGGALVWTAPAWLFLDPRRAPSPPPWLSFAAALGAAGVWLGGGWLFQPAYPDTLYVDRWTPEVRHWDTYYGQILSASLGPVTLARGRIPGARALLAAGEPLEVTAVAGPAVSHDPAPLLIITDQRRRDIVILGVHRDDLLLSRWTHATALRLDRPALRLQGALAGVAPADTFTVSTAQFAGLGFTVGDAWQLLFYPQAFAPWALRLLSAVWVGGTLLLAGWWGGASRSPLLPALGVACAVATLAAGPALVGLHATPLGQWLGAACGLGVPWSVRRLLAGRR